MNESRPIRLGVLALFAAIVLLSGASEGRAACESGGMSGTGVAPEGDGAGTGTGGTGRERTGGSGAGGTGFSTPGESGDEPGTGSGGTGFLGVITGFGSVCLNGEKVEYDEQTAIEIDGAPARAADLAVGQLVRIATREERPTHAREIRVQNVLAGTIDRVVASERVIWVMGQRVELPRAEAGAPGEGLRSASGRVLEPGHRVAISGFRARDGIVSATRVVELDRARPAMATAVVSSVESSGIVVGGVRAELAERDRARGRELAGQRVRVRGEWNPGRRVLERAVVEPASSIAAGSDRVSIQGIAMRGSAPDRLRIDEVEVDGRGVAESLRGVSDGSRVRVEGHVEGGRVRASQIFVEDRGHSRDRTAGARDRDHGRRSRSDRSDRADRSGRADRADRGDRGDRGDRSDRGDRGDRSERSGR